MALVGDEPLIFISSMVFIFERIAITEDFPIGPAPISAKVFESFLARSFAASPGIAPVLTELRRFADI